MARQKRMASESISVESTPERSSPARRRSLRAKNASSPLKPAPKSPPKRGRPKSAPKASKGAKKDKSLNTEKESNTEALVRAFSASSKENGVITEADIHAATTPAQVTALISSLVSTEQDVLFQQYREKAAEQEAKNSVIIADFASKLDEKQSTIDSLAHQIQELQNQLAEAEERLDAVDENSMALTTPQRRAGRRSYESPIRRKPSDKKVHHSNVDDEFRTIAFTFDMLELLTGIRIVDYKVDQDNFLFDVKHSSTVSPRETETVTIEYQLSIQREFESCADVTYVPVFLECLSKRARDAEQEAKNKDAAMVKNHLPAYLQQSLTFPYSALSQFYTKLSKALNQSVRS
ncbi:hypothetical protein OXX80_000917 [Metschnikowia pulcherrima]